MRCSKQYTRYDSECPTNTYLEFELPLQFIAATRHKRIKHI